MYFFKSVRDSNHMCYKVEEAKIFVEMWGEMAKFGHLTLKSNGKILEFLNRKKCSYFPLPTL